MVDILTSDVFLIERKYKNLFFSKTFFINVGEIPGQKIFAEISSFQARLNINVIDNITKIFFSISQKLFSKSYYEYCVTDTSGLAIGFIKEHLNQSLAEDCIIENGQHQKVAMVKLISNDSLGCKNRTKYIFNFLDGDACLGDLSIEQGFVYHKSTIDLKKDEKRIIDRRIAIALALLLEGTIQRWETRG